VIFSEKMEEKKIKGIIFISNVTKAMEHEWFVEYIDKSKFELSFVLFNSKNSHLYHFIRNRGFDCKNYRFTSNYFLPFYIFYFSLKLRRLNPDFVHCHLFQASLIGIVAARIAGIKKRIHTRHHADIHHVSHPHAVKYDKLVNLYSTHIVAVSNNGKKILMLMEGVPADKITVIPHGIPLQLINQNVAKQNIDVISKKYKLNGHYPIIGVVSRFVEWKGVQYIIPAFKNLIADYPNAKLVLANANGNYQNEINQLLKTIPQTKFVTISFENDIAALFKTFDVFVHVPVDRTSEAFGQVYIEALSLSIPMVCTISGIADELIEDNKNALVVDYKNPTAIHTQVKTLLENENLRNRIIQQGLSDLKDFTFEQKIKQLTKLYIH